MIPKYFRCWLMIGLCGAAYSLSFGQTNDPCIPANTSASALRCAFGALPMAPLPITSGALYVSHTDTSQTAFTTYLYPNGSNAMPAGHRSAGETIAASLQPLNARGNVDLANGKIVVVAEGFSNTNDEMIRFLQAFYSSNPAVNPKLQIKNFAEPGCNLICWLDKGVGTVDPQVQIVIMKHSNNVPQNANGAPKVPNQPFMTAASKRFPNHARVTKEQLKTRILEVKKKYPNLKLLYLTSRIYGGWSCNPAAASYREPVAYEEGFSVKWLIESQILGTDSTLNFSGPNAKAPWLAWGPYIWDSTWPQNWYRDDVHSCTTGQLVVAQKWFDFLRQDGTSRTWFRDNVAPSTPASLSAKVVNSSQIDLSWNPATDNSSSVKYKIYRDGALLRQTASTTYSDLGLNPSTLYCYAISAIDSAGNESAKSNQVCATTFTTGIADNSSRPLQYKLLQNYPNPVRHSTERSRQGPATEIRFELPVPNEVSIKIYNMIGEKIRTLVEATYAAGSHLVHWNGNDQAGNPVANGIYLYQLRVVPSTGSGRGFSEVKRMTVLR